jgi:2,4-dienoyl-CoA reductase-like NADH-dependent reductase (Old Yellow Enzyme family)
VGGAGLVIAEATAVSPEGRITPHDLGIWKDEHIPKLEQIVRFIHAQGAYAAIQLAHAGRKASMSRPWQDEQLVLPDAGGWANVVAPSPVAFASHYAQPRALDSDGIRKVISDFSAAARRAHAAGFAAVEIHAAHGYLLHEFLSPLSNLRTDQYGGSFDNRIRLLLEVTEAVRREWPERLPLLVRISATDWAEGGWDPGQSVALAKVLKGCGVDLIDVSSGGLLPRVQIPVGPGFQTPFAERIRAAAEIPTAAVGMITDAAQADHIVRTGQADIVLLARELLRDPYWPLHAAARLGKRAPWPPQYLRAAAAGSPVRDEVALD